jgi:hypothetical protein
MQGERQFARRNDEFALTVRTKAVEYLGVARGNPAHDTREDGRESGAN